MDGGRYRRRLWNAAAVSLGGMALYYLMLARGTAARATANFYLVPGTAALMAWVLLDEGLSALTVVGLAVSSLGCWLVSRRKLTAGARYDSGATSVPVMRERSDAAIPIVVRAYCDRDCSSLRSE